MAKESKTIDTSDREMIISRLVNAPRELVFKVWTDPKHIDKWWGPNGFTNTFLEMNVKPGGVARFIMHGPNGVDYPNRIIYTDVIKPEKIVYVHDSDIDNDPSRFETTITFESQGNKTLITLRAVFVTAEEYQKVVKEYGAIEGGNQTLSRFEEFLMEVQEEELRKN